MIPYYPPPPIGRNPFQILRYETAPKSVFLNRLVGR
jgi:hypothetical protein